MVVGIHVDIRVDLLGIEANVLQDVDLAALGPASLIDVLAKSPDRGPSARPVGIFALASIRPYRNGFLPWVMTLAEVILLPCQLSFRASMISFPFSIRAFSGLSV